MTHAVTEEVAQIHRRPGIEGLAHHGGGEAQQAHHEERAAAQQRQHQRHEIPRACLRSAEHVARVRQRLRVTLLGARLAQEQQVGEKHQARHARAEHEQRAPADPVLQQQPHALTCGGIPDEVAAGEDRGHRAVAGIVEPPGGDLDESRPTDRLRQPVADPREGEYRQRGAGGEQQREGRGAAGGDEQVALAAPIVPEAGEKPLAQRIGEHAPGGHRADADDGVGVTDAASSEFVDQQRRRHRKVGAAEVTGRVAQEQERQCATLREAQCARGGHGGPGRGRRDYASHGSEYVLMLVKLLTASCTPSLYPRPESLIPPNGVSSRR